MMEYRLVEDKLVIDGDRRGAAAAARSSLPIYDQEQPTDLSSSSRKREEQDSAVGKLPKKFKPIPPPLDLTQNNQNQQSATSPKYSDKDKNLPLRKRWHSWSPVPMNGQADEVSASMVPLLYPAETKQTGFSHQDYHLPPSYSTPSPRWALEYVPTSGNNNVTKSMAHSSTSANGDLQTPTPFYTPNEPSPKFMNSPVFSYSIPEPSFYQGPFSPIRATSLYPPPSSPFTNLSLNSPPQQGTAGGGSNGGSSSYSNMIPSTLLSPAPSQASNNSLSYEDLQEHKSSSSSPFFQPVWSIFLPGTKIRMNNMEWYPVDYIVHDAKGDFAPNGLEVRKFIVTSSAKERIQLTFCPVGDPHHPPIEVNCEPGHPFMVDKKGWCAVKPEVFHEIYGSHCQPLECGDVCLPTTATATRNSPQHGPQYHQMQHHFPASQPNGNISNIKMEAIDEQCKPVPISVLPSITTSSSTTLNCRKTFASPASANKKHTTAKGKRQTNSGGTNNALENKGRRPMNGFLLFAKDKRPELIQMYPGKDNRSISVLLGEAWQKLDPIEREKYSSNAKLRAEEQKKIHPDCWKRKSKSINSCNPTSSSPQMLTNETKLI